MSDIFDELKWRGLIHQTTDDERLPGWLLEKSRTLYAGFDPTADSLHVGHLVALMILRRFQQAGHQPIAIVGGATGMIGDPSGKSAERNLLSLDALRSNVERMQAQMQRFLNFQEGSNRALLLNNYDWINKFSVLEFLRDIGKNFPVNVMLSKDSVRSRLERSDSGLSYTEFSYMLLQAYDFVHLNRAHGCELQVGGSDQWGNITAGIDLARRMHSVQLYGMTCPLLTKSDGTKMGKTESGALWLSPEETTPYQFYQYWVNVDDADAGKCLRYFTDLSRSEIEALDQARQQEPERRESQRRLAEEITRLVHGQEALDGIMKGSQAFFGGGKVTTVSAEAALGAATDAKPADDQLLSLFGGVTLVEVPRAPLASGEFSLAEAFTVTGLTKSKSEFRRLVDQGGAYVRLFDLTGAPSGDVRLEDVDQLVDSRVMASESLLALRSGKKKYAVVKFISPP